MIASLAAWRDLWRSAYPDEQRDMIRLAYLTPSIAYAVALAWTMLPA